MSKQISYDDMIKALTRGICEVVHKDKYGNNIKTYATMNKDLATEFGFPEFKLTEKRIADDRRLGLATVLSIQDKRYARLNLNLENLVSFKSIRGKKIPSRTEGYEVLKLSYEELVSMLIKGKVTVKFIKKDGSERVMVATRNPQLIRAMSNVVPEFSPLESDKSKGFVSVFDCEKKEKRVINYRTLVELIGFEGPEDSQVKIIRVIYKGKVVTGYVFNLMGVEAALDLADSFKLIETGICLNARIDNNKITYSGNIDRTDKAGNLISIDRAIGIIRDRTQDIVKGEDKYVDVKIKAEKKVKDLRKLIDLLNNEYGYNIPYDVKEISVEFK